MREDILRRVNKLLASFMPMQIAAKPQVKISKKSAITRIALQFHQRRRVEETTRKRSTKSV
jgi:hypothetical protein